MKLELRRLTFEEQVRNEKKKVGGSLIESAAAGSLKPWREVVTPHADVASGRYQQAEFAADLWQVHIGEGGDEYKNPKEFFRRTYLTESLKRLLVGAVRRVSGEGGDPVVQLQTNFGGGKTHSMLALYHLFSGTPTERPARRRRRDGRSRREERCRRCKRVVLVGNKISPGQSRQRSRTARWCARCGASWRGSSAARRPSRASRRTTRRRRARATCCASCSSSTARA